MSNLEKLLEGVEVEWKPLSNPQNGVAELSRGRVMSKEYLVENAGEYPVYSSQTANNGEIGKIKTFDYDVEGITWTTDGANAGTVFHRTGRFSITNVCGLIKIKDTNELNYKFLFYWLSIEAKKYVYSGMGNPKLMSNQIAKIPIPIPPLEIQEEIVRILDKFSTLTAELQAELQARKSQYEYYRNQLLDYPMEESDQPSLRSSGSAPSIKESDNQIQQQSAQNHPTNNSVLQPQGKVQWKTLGEIGRFYGGLTGKSKDDFTNGNAKFITYKNVYANPSLNLDIKETVRIYDGERQHTLKYADIIFTGSSETPDECGLSSVVTERIDEKLYLNSFCFFLRLFDTEIIIPTFAKHLFRSKYLRQQISRTASGVTRFNVSKKLMEKVLIPIPPIKEQERIAFILDKFDTLTNSISEGLPKEIELRQKQYEYYRDMLLTFPTDNIEA